MSRMAKTPDPPYVAVIFSSLRVTLNGDDYSRTAERMEELAGLEPGFLGIESARDESGYGITVSYWKDLQSAHRWKDNAEHRLAQQRGRSRWYRNYAVRIAVVERDYGHSND
ncbi:MAG: antibiotic biosynthesis monooxygenase [Planctomycetota bacterium]